MKIFRYEARKSMRAFIRRILSSRTGWFLAIAHLGLMIYDFAQKSPEYSDPNECILASGWNFSGYLIARRFFHFAYESAIHQTFMLLDLPAQIAGGLLLMLPIYIFLPSDICAATRSWIDAGVLLIATSLQWLMIGYGIEKLFRRKSEALS